MIDSKPKRNVTELKGLNGCLGQNSWDWLKNAIYRIAYDTNKALSGVFARTLLEEYSINEKIAYGLAVKTVKESRLLNPQTLQPIDRTTGVCANFGTNINNNQVYELDSWVKTKVYPYYLKLVSGLEKSLSSPNFNTQLDGFNDLFFQINIILRDYSLEKNTSKELIDIKVSLLQEIFFPLEEVVDNIILNSGKDITIISGTGVKTKAIKKLLDPIIPFVDNNGFFTSSKDYYQTRGYVLKVVDPYINKEITSPATVVVVPKENILTLPGVIIPSPIVPTPIAPTPIAPTPIAPTPIAPTPIAPTPVVATPTIIPKTDYTIYIVGAGAVAILAVLLTKKSKE